MNNGLNRRPSAIPGWAAAIAFLWMALVLAGYYSENGAYYVQKFREFIPLLQRLT